MENSYYRIRRLKHLIIVSLSCFFFLSFNQMQAQVIEQDILGRWTMESTGDAFTGGAIHFLDGNNYAFQKEFPDGTKAELKGGYLLDTEAIPARLRLCLGDCNAAGSEWTSNFCIVRMAPDNRLEILMSQTGDYPDRFPKDRNSKGMYLFVREK